MKKSFMNNIKNFVDSNVRQRIDRAANNNSDFFGDDLLLVERQFEDIRHVYVEAEKRISILLQSLNTSQTPLGAYTQNVQASLNNLAASTTSGSPCPPASADVQFTSYRAAKIVGGGGGGSGGSMSEHPQPSNSNQHSIDACATELREDMRRHKKLPIVGFLKFLAKSCHKLKPDSLLATTLTHCSQLQTQLTQLHLTYEQTIETQCLKPIRQILEIDVPNVIKLRKLFIKSHNDLESMRAKHNAASQKQQQQQLHSSHSTSTSYTIAQNTVQQANTNKLDQLKKDLDDAEARFEQARDTYAAELYAFVCRETELANFFIKFYQYQAEYHQHVGHALQSSLPPLNSIIANTPRRAVFGTPLEENLRCTGRTLSLVIEMCIHLLYTNGLNEEGLFRIPGSSLKIRKLKNAINAWFVTLASHNDLETSYQVQKGSDPSVVAIHELFKDIIGLRPQPDSSAVNVETSNNQSATAPITMKDEPAASQLVVFDVNTIAGLLKLYLRELPDPLFTYALHQQWIDATLKCMKEGQLTALEHVVQQLPRANQDNLQHLIRFLHLLTCHCETNKMTATNLAITMAPSLIWDRPVEVHQQVSCERQQVDGQQPVDDMQALNMQMSNVGISASLHALVVENLINHAEKLFSGPVQFTIPGLNMDSNMCTSDQMSLKQNRGIKSTSPTGLSTASSSSFSSTSNASLASAASKSRHSRKGGSMDGLLNYDKGTVGVDKQKSNRPVSVIFNQLTQSNSQSVQPPPIPPAPAIRSHMKQSGDSTRSTKQATSESKPPAPSIPPHTTLRRQQPVEKKNETQSDKIINRLAKKQMNAPSSSSNQSMEPQASTYRPTPSPTFMSINQNSSRPTVPPPNRPTKDVSKETSEPSALPSSSQLKEIEIASPLNDNRSSHSQASSGLLRAEFEEVHAVDVDDISVQSVSPIASLDSISAGDSSFDQDSNSLENSWTQCDLEQNQMIGTHSAENTKTQSTTTEGPSDTKAPGSNESMLKQPEIRHNVTNQDATTDTDNKLETEASLRPPVKPPRCLSPKITQSTPL